MLELALTAIVVVPYLNHSHKVSSSELKTMSAVHVFLIEGIVLGAILLLGTLVRRRALLGFASLLVGAWLVEIKALAILGIAYLGFGLWLVVKVLKHSNKEGRRSASPRGGQRARETTQGGEELRADCQGARVTLGAQAQQALHPTKAEPAHTEEARPCPLPSPEELISTDRTSAWQVSARLDVSPADRVRVRPTTGC